MILRNLFLKIQNNPTTLEFFQKLKLTAINKNVRNAFFA